MASTCVKRTPSSDGNNKKFTWSGWVKRSQIGVSQHLWSTWYQNDARYSYFQFNADDTLEVYSGIFSTSPSSTSMYLNTKAKFRDTNGWYHIVLRADTDDGTQADRVRVYVNGVSQEFDSGHSNGQTLPSSGATTFYNKQYLHTLGRYANTGGFFDGLMSHVHWCDGYSYAPTEFGETDTTTGEWKIKTSPSVSYGTNGFFILKDGNSTTDQSGNSLSFTTEGTLTKTEDNPSDVFATLNPLAGSSSNNTLSNGNTSLQVGSGWRWRPSTLAPSKGKFYYEVKMTGSTPLYEVVGVVPYVNWKDIDGETIGLGESVGWVMSGAVKKDNSTEYTGNTYTVGDVVCVAVDLDNRKIYFRKNADAWENSGDPTSGATGTGAVSLSTTLDDWSLSTSAAGADAGSSLNYGNGYFGTTAISSAGTNASNIGLFEFDVPTGYTALSLKGMNS